MRTHVLVIGGGIGGLTLAHGLRTSGVSVAVYERDRTRTDRLQGYRIHINPAGARALADCLPASLFDTFEATAGVGGSDFTFMSERGRELLRLDAPETHYSVSRITLRQVLLTGLDDAVHFDRKFTHYETGADGRITAHFADGSSAVGDVLVAADGVHSSVRRQRLPHAKVTDTGIVAIAGKTPLTDATRAALPARLLTGATSVIPRGGHGMFIAVQEFARTPAPAGIGGNDAALGSGFLFDNTADYVMWAYIAPRSRYGREVAGTPAELHATAQRMTARWSPDLRRLLELADPDSTSTWPIRTSVPVEAWEPSNVTLLGDAIHSMTPMRGIGANTALRDAATLRAALIAADRGERPLLDTIGDYEAAMRNYGFKAVRDSLTAAKQAVSRNVAARTAFRTFLTACTRFPTLKAKTFGTFGTE